MLGTSQNDDPLMSIDTDNVTSNPFGTIPCTSQLISDGVLESYAHHQALFHQIFAVLNYHSQYHCTHKPSHLFLCYGWM